MRFCIENESRLAEAGSERYDAGEAAARREQL